MFPMMHHQGMGPPKPQANHQECLLVGTVNIEQSRQLHARLEGLSDRPTEHDECFKTFYTMKSPNNTVKLALVRKERPTDHRVEQNMLLEYLGTIDTQVHEKLAVRTVVRSYVNANTNPQKFLTDLGFKHDYEAVLRGKRYRYKKIDISIRKATLVAGNDPNIAEMLTLAESLRSIVRLGKYDPTRMKEK
eukprot:sb/3471176/